MVYPTSASLEYDVHTYAQSTTVLAALMDEAAVPLDTGLLIKTATRLTSDTTTPVGNDVQRVVVVDLTRPPFFPAMGGAVVPVGAQGQIQVRSTSPEDSASGTGARSVLVSYHDAAGNAHTETIALNGVNEVSSVNTDYRTITDVTPASTGSVPANLGQLTFTLSQKGLPRRKYCLGILSDSFYTRFPTASTWSQAFNAWLTGGIKKAVGPLITKVPVLT